MKSIQALLKSESSVEAECARLASIAPQLVLLFGSTDAFKPEGQAAQVARRLPGALVIGCSTAGEISDRGVFNNSLVVTAARFDQPDFRPVQERVRSMEDTFEAGRRLGAKLDRKGLRAVFLLGRGLQINGSALVAGIREVVGDGVVLTGGLAGDGGRFERTFTILNGEISDDQVVGFGIHGDRVSVAFGSQGGWEPFGPVRRITRCHQNVLYELDGEPALDLYKKYLGDKARELPSSGLLFPFAILKDNQDSTGIIRTILAVDEKEKSLTFAGDIPPNGIVRLMHAKNDGLVSGARRAAEHTLSLVASEGQRRPDHQEGLGILISCVGRKLVMGEDVDEELEAVQDVLRHSTLTGFYSYGEICPHMEADDTKLHNQTMTITYLYEKKAA